MEPKKKLELKPEQLTTAPRGTKIQIPKQPPFKLTGEIIQRKNTDMQTEAPKRRPLVDTGSNEVFNIPSETRDYKSILNAANQEMKTLVKKVEKLSKKKEAKPMETQTEAPKRKTLSDSGSNTLYVQEPKTFSSIGTETQKIPQQKKLIFNSKKIGKKKYLDALKQFTPSNLLSSVNQKPPNIINIKSVKKLPTLTQPSVEIDIKEANKDILRSKANSILASSGSMPPAFKQYSMEKPHEHSLSRFNKKKKEPSIKSKSLLNVADLNTQSNTNEIKKFVKKLNMFEDASKGDKKMRDIIQGLQLKDKIPDFIKKCRRSFTNTTKTRKISNKNTKSYKR